MQIPNYIAPGQRLGANGLPYAGFKKLDLRLISDSRPALIQELPPARK